MSDVEFPLGDEIVEYASIISTTPITPDTLFQAGSDNNYTVINFYNP